MVINVLNGLNPVASVPPMGRDDLDCATKVAAIERVALVHTNAPAYVAELCQKASHLLPMGNILTEDITPVIGAHIGPGAAGFAVIKARS